MTSQDRTYPLKQPPNHRPPVPRWHVIWPDHITHVYTAYIGAQCHGDTDGAANAMREARSYLDKWTTSRLGSTQGSSEAFSCLQGTDVPGSLVRVCYWTDAFIYEQAVKQLDLRGFWDTLEPVARKSIGLWCETFANPISRIESNYTGLDYLPGIASLEGADAQAHTLTAYWGAARDRIPDAAHDKFPPADDVEKTESGGDVKGLGEHVTGSNYVNLVHIRTGQFWETCGQEEQEAYEKKLEPTLEKGLEFLWNNPERTGAMGLRYMRNVPEGSDSDHQIPRKETCVAGFFTSLSSLEKWAHTHKSHLAIYNGAMNHAKVFGLDRKFRTWHEVNVLEEGKARFEYVNCVAGTGILGRMHLNAVPLQ